MRNNHLQAGLQKLTDSKVSVVTYVIGLAASMAICMLIGLWIHNKAAANDIRQDTAACNNIVRN